jgi:glycine/D-amino acid oxidase-like deaminating enzyme
MNCLRRLLFALLLTLLMAAPLGRAAVFTADICVFGGTSGGIAAAIQAKRMGRSVLLVEPGRYLGGLTTGGLGATDIGNKAAIGGVSLEFYRRVARHYAQDGAWKLEAREDYFTKRGSGQTRAANLSDAAASMWTFEPHVADQVFAAMLKEAGIQPRLKERLKSVRMGGGRIAEFTTDSGHRYRAAVFIDATYEGDLMAKAGVSFHVGREANAVYGETLNGVRAQTPHHQFIVPVDPYRVPGDPSSGLLPFIQPGDGGVPGSGDAKVQAYNYRLCFTTNAANRMPLTAPRGYKPAQYELLARYLEALVKAGKHPTLSMFWHPIWMPNHKTDINNNGGFSTDAIGMNWGYANGSYAEREKIEQEHERYIRGFLHFLATSPRVPDGIRAEMKLWGPCRDEFRTTRGWPRQLYVREARRLVGAYVMSEKNCRYQEVIEDSIGLAAYNMDSHNIQRIVKNGRVENEGDVQIPPMKPYPISYRSLIPKAGECSNLLVPVCLSSSHIAYGSIRMEPVFMILGQSAATAAAMAVESQTTVQSVPYAPLRQRLLADGQILEWKDGGIKR